MFSYEALKFFHILSAFIFIGLAAVYFLSAAKSKTVSAVMYTASVTTLLGGFGLIGALGQGMPMWMLLKFAIWIAVMAFIGIVMKRFANKRGVATVGLFALAAAAIYLAVFKPL